MQKNWKGYMKKIFIIFLLVFFINVYAVEGYNANDYFMMCDKDGYGAIIRDIFIEGEKAFFINYSDSYNYNFFKYEFVSNYEEVHSKYLNYLDVFKELGIENEKKYLLRLIWDDMYGNLEKVFCDQTEEEKEKYQKLKDKINTIEAGPDFINEDIRFLEENEYVLEDELLKYYDIRGSEGLVLNFLENKLLLSGTEGEYELILEKKHEFNEPAKVYQYEDDVAIKYGYGLSKRHVVKVIIEKKDEVTKENIKDEVVESPVSNQEDIISFVPDDTSCFFILKKLILKIIYLIFG